jgi:hypothetical protein
VSDLNSFPRFDPRRDTGMTKLGMDVLHRVPTRNPEVDEPEDWPFVVSGRTRCGLPTYDMRLWFLMPPFPVPQDICPLCEAAVPQEE